MVADTRARAQDAAETVVPELEPLPVVLDPRAAADPGSPLLFPDAGSNVADAFEEAWDEDVLAGSDVVARVTVRYQRVAPLRSRPRRCSPSPAATARSRCGRRRRSRSPCGIRSANASPRGGPGPRGGAGRRWWVRRQAGSLPRVRGDRRRGGPAGRAKVAWVPSRSESMVSLTHGRAQVHEVELGATREGASSVSAWTSCPTWAPTRSPRTWRTRRGRCCRACTASAHRVTRRSVVTTIPPVGPYRGRPSRGYPVDRASGRCPRGRARHGSGRVRRRNLVPNYRFPFTTAGSTYDVGDYERALDEALRLAGVEQRRREQADGAPPATVARSGSGSRPTWSAPGPPGRSSRRSRSRRTARRPHGSGPPPLGQGHETAFAQIISGVLGIEVARIRGPFGHRRRRAGRGHRSRRGATDRRVVAVRGGGRGPRTGTRARLGVPRGVPEDIVPTDGGLGVAGSPASAIAWSDLSAASDGGSLSASARRFQQELTFPFGAHVATVEVDVDTGEVHLLEHVAVDDCGRVLNPMIVEGQVHGGLGQGIAQALFEEVVFDEHGTPVTSTLATYLFPAASELRRSRRSASRRPRRSTRSAPRGSASRRRSARRRRSRTQQWTRSGTSASGTSTCRSRLNASCARSGRAARSDPPLLGSLRCPPRRTGAPAPGPPRTLPTWSPRARTPRLPVRRGGSYQAYTWDLATGDVRRVTHERGRPPRVGLRRRVGGRLVLGPDRRGGGAVARDALRRGAAPRGAAGRPARVAGRARARCRARGGRDRRPRGIRRLRVRARRGGQGDLPGRGPGLVLGHRRAHRGVRPRRPVGGRVAVHRGGERRRQPPSAAGRPRPRTGAVVGELADPPGFALWAFAWSRVPGDRRLLFGHELADRSGPRSGAPTRASASTSRSTCPATSPRSTGGPTPDRCSFATASGAGTGSTGSTSPAGR